MAGGPVDETQGKNGRIQEIGRPVETKPKGVGIFQSQPLLVMNDEPGRPSLYLD